MNAELANFIESLGIDYAAVFVPQSVSRNAGEKHASLNWRVMVCKGRTGIATDYMQGIGHLPKDPQTDAKHKGARRDCIMIADHETRCAETGKYGLHHSKPIPAPPLADVLHSLVLDSDCTDEGFDYWAENYGYDIDSRKALETFETCRDIGIKLRRMIGSANLERLQELFSGY